MAWALHYPKRSQFFVHLVKEVDMKSLQKGFTLIELMIVVAIIGILAAIAIPAYSNYQAKAKMSAGLAEVSAAKSIVEIKINEGTAITDLASAGLTSPTANCTLAVSITAGAGNMTCTVLNAPPQVNGAVMKWTRVVDGGWTCVTTGLTDATLSPKSCPQ